MPRLMNDRGPYRQELKVTMPIIAARFGFHPQWKQECFIRCHTQACSMAHLTPCPMGT
jgi:hypothetical protein